MTKVENEDSLGQLKIQRSEGGKGGYSYYLKAFTYHAKDDQGRVFQNASSCKGMIYDVNADVAEWQTQRT
jgi:hypothetical protein